MGVAQNNHDMEDGNLEIGMGMCFFSLVLSFAFTVLMVYVIL